MTYREKIERILEQKLEYNGDHQKNIEEVKIWLCCEWQYTDMSTEDYVELRDMVEPIAKRLIQEM